MRRGLLLVLAVACVALPSCRRSGSEVWQDTKSCGRHCKMGFLSLFGIHPPEERMARRSLPEEECDFVPLHDEDLYGQVMAGEIDADTAIPQSGLALGRDLPGIEGFMEPTGELVQVFQMIHFDTDDYSLRGDNNLKCVQQIARYLKRHPNTFVFIEGHCDERGAAAYNLALGSRRSNAVRNQLIKSGVDLNRLFTVSYGKEKPIVNGHTASDWRQNRRAQFKIYERKS